MSLAWIMWNKTEKPGVWTGTGDCKNPSHDKRVKPERRTSTHNTGGFGYSVNSSMEICSV